MRILLVSNLFPPDYDGGYELNAWKIARGLRDRGESVDVLTSKFRPGFRGERSEPEWVYRMLENRPHLPPPTWKMPWVRLPMIYHLIHRESIAWVNVPIVRRFLKGRSYDLVYIFGLHDVGLGCAYVPQEMGLPILWHFGDHFLADHQSRYTRSPLFNLTGNTILRSVRVRESRIVLKNAAFVSSFLQKYFLDRGVAPEHSYVVPRGVEFPVYDGEPREIESLPVFLLASRLSKDKGVHVALEAGKILAARRPELAWEIQVAGSGDEAYRDRLQAMADSIPGRVRLLGRLSREETLDKMRHSFAFISASTWPEPFGNTIIESLGMGVPLIASEAGSLLEVVESGRSALTYSPESPEDLANQMERLLTSPELQQSLALEGAAVVRERYTLPRILDRTVELMNEIVQREHAP